MKTAWLAEPVPEASLVFNALVLFPKKLHTIFPSELPTFPVVVFNNKAALFEPAASVNLSFSALPPALLMKNLKIFLTKKLKSSYL